MSHAFSHIMDALDVETFLVCDSEEEGKELALLLMKDLGFEDVDVVFLRFQGAGVRVRVRAYLYRPGDAYPWLNLATHGGAEQ